MSKERTQDHTFHRTLDMISEGSPVHEGYHDVVFQRGLKRPGEKIKPFQEFPEYEMEFWRNSACLDFARSISHVTIDHDRIVEVSREYLSKSHPQQHYEGEVRGTIAEIAFKLALDSIYASEHRFVPFSEDVIVDNYRLTRTHDKIASYKYFEKQKQVNGVEWWKTMKEYDGIVLVQDAYGVFKPLVVEVKTQTTRWSNEGIQPAIRPGAVEAKLKPLSHFFIEPFAYGIVASPERITGRSPLQAHFIDAGGLVIPHPLTNKEIENIVSEVRNPI